MAQTIANTAAGIMAAIGQGGIPGLIFGGIIAAMGAAQLAVIAGTSYQGGSASAASVPKSIEIGERSNKVDVAQSGAASSELAYLRGEAGRGRSASDFKPGGFMGNRYRAYGGSAYVVGEQGPEIFTPEVPGRLITNDNIASMGTPVSVSFNVSAIDSTNMQDMLTTQRGNIISMIREAANSHGSGFLEEVDVSTYAQETGGGT